MHGKEGVMEGKEGRLKYLIAKNTDVGEDEGKQRTTYRRKGEKSKACEF